MQNIRLDAGAAALLARLHGAGYAAYAVGGCVRDSLLGRTPQDWDLCTSARPEQVLALFGEGQCIPTGLQHGTVTIKYGGQLYETTTFRTEGAYTDGRHPDEVHFVPDVRQDLARRDFTINAMAYNDAEGLIDPFGGQQDLQQGILRAVGDPATRFEEDALRILRLYRFAARFGFAIDPPTGQAARALCAHLDCVSVERIEEELSKLLAAPAPAAYQSGAFRPGIAGRKAGGGCLPGGHRGPACAVGRIADEPWRGWHPQGPETPALLQHLHRADGGAGEGNRRGRRKFLRGPSAGVGPCCWGRGQQDARPSYGPMQTLGAATRFRVRGGSFRRSRTGRCPRYGHPHPETAGPVRPAHRAAAGGAGRCHGAGTGG